MVARLPIKCKFDRQYGAIKHPKKQNRSEKNEKRNRVFPKPQCPA